ncbi:hypothetical protein B7978_06240 [Vibrio cholerae]|nr:hypothetical protein B7978_06240 [Vibrio cholerae]
MSNKSLCFVVSISERKCDKPKHPNLVLIRKAPEHAALTTYQKQTTKGLTVESVEEVKWPVPDGSIYPPK